MKTVFFDVDTQIDFLYPAGALYVPGAEIIISSLAQLVRHAAHCSIPLISTADAHIENDPEFEIWKPHCVVGTVGQQRPASLLLNELLVVSSAPNSIEQVAANIPLVPQILLEKQHIDCFSNPNLLPLLQLLQADRFVVFGVVTEICVQKAVLGLLTLGARVELVTDAVRSLNENAADRFFQALQEQGGRLTTVGAVVANYS